MNWSASAAPWQVRVENPSASDGLKSSHGGKLQQVMMLDDQRKRIGKGIHPLPKAA